VCPSGPFVLLWFRPFGLSRLDRPEVLIHPGGSVGKIAMSHDVVPAVSILGLVA